MSDETRLSADGPPKRRIAPDIDRAMEKSSKRIRREPIVLNVGKLGDITHSVKLAYEDFDAILYMANCEEKEETALYMPIPYKKNQI